MSINKKNNIPLYHQVEDYIRKKIRDEKLKPGDLLPTEAELEEILKVSRTTIRIAISELQHEGIVYKQQGRGTFVAKRSYEEQLPLLKSFTEDAIAKGCKSRASVLGKDIIVPDEKIAGRLKLTENDKVLKLFRVRYLDGEPIQVTTTHVPLKEIPNMDLDKIDFTQASLYEEMEKSGVVFASGEEIIEVDVAGAIDAALMGVECGSPIFVTKRIVFNDKNRVVEAAESRTRGDRHRAVIKLVR